MQEFESTKLLKDTLEAAGFKVELGGAGMPTNLWAEWGSGQPKIAIVTEIDALPGGSQTPGEFDAQAAGEGRARPHGGPQHPRRRRVDGGVRGQAGDAAQQYPRHGRDLVRPGRGAAGEPALHRARRLFQGCRCGHLSAHPRHAQHDFGIGNYAAISSIFTFHGKTAHGAVNPWDGKDAVDAVELMDIGFDKLREHLRPTYRAHRTITFGGIQPNIIPDKGQIWWFVRDASMPAAKETYDKLAQDRRGRGADDRHDLRRASIPPRPGRSSSTRRSPRRSRRTSTWSACRNGPRRSSSAPGISRSNMRSRWSGFAPRVTPLGGRPQAASSNDSGDVSWVVPAGSLNFPSAIPGIEAHEWKAAVFPTSSISHKGQVAGAKTLAASIIDLLTSAGRCCRRRAPSSRSSRRRRPISRWCRPTPSPTSSSTRSEMEKYRAEMRKFYLNKTPRFN